MRTKNTLPFKKNHFEKTAWSSFSVVCGIDEVGRGCLAGPLVTGAVILPINKTSPLLQDSKVLSPAEREKAFKWIEKNAWYSIGIVHQRIIDKYNIWHATLLAMKRALINLLATCPLQPQAILVDAMPLSLADTGYSTIPVHYFTQGEKKSSSIAAASIVAKVTRDRLMEQFDRVLPGYNMGQHKGYSTKAHKMSVHRHSYTIIHRHSFLGFLSNKEKDDQQQRLC